jgi:hypothetical protein
MKNTMILLAMMLTAFTAMAKDEDDTIKIYRVTMAGNVPKVSISGYANVSIVGDTISYLTAEGGLLDSGKDKKPEFSYNSQEGLTISARPGAKPLVVHLKQEGNWEIFTEDYATVTVSQASGMSVLRINTSDYSQVSVMPSSDKDTLRVNTMGLRAEDFSKISVVVPCAGDILRMKSEDFATLHVSYFRGANLFESVSDFAKLTIDSYDGVLNYEYSDAEEFAEQVRAKVDRKVDKLRIPNLSHLPSTGLKGESSKKNTNKPGFHLSFAWAFTNWGDATLSGLNGMSAPYSLGTTFSSYQLALIHTPLNIKHWVIGIGIGYESDVYRFSGDVYTSVVPTQTPDVNTFDRIEHANAKWASRLVARYVTMPLSVMYKTSKKFGIALAAIPGLNYTSGNTGLKHKGKSFTDNAKVTNVEDVSHVMNPYKLDARLTLVFSNIGVFVQMPTMPVFKNMDRDVYPIKFGFILGL